MIELVGLVELSKFNTFTLVDVFNLVGNKKTASSIVSRLLKKGFVKKIRNNLYTCANITDGQVVASKYHIASAINESSYISHHSAFEYYGLSNQIYYEVYVSSNNRFNNFEFEGIKYKYVSSSFNDGVINPKGTNGIRITSLERTVVDSIKDFTSIGGIEELLSCIELILYLDEKEIVKFLDRYELKFLYQKSGFLLEQYKSKFQLSDKFFEYCKEKTGKSTRYLSEDSTVYNEKWKLVVPENLFEIIAQGGGPIV